MAQTGNKNDVSALFTQLILTFHAAAWQQLGKTINPLTGKVERNLDLAKNSIDILGMIEEKSRGNLAVQESNLLRHILTELRMNYIDEMKKEAQQESKAGSERKTQKPPEQRAENDKPGEGT